MIDSVKPPLVIFVAMPVSDMGLHATWIDTAAIKHHLYDPVAEQVAAALGAEVDLRIEKDKISQGAIHRSMFNEALQAPVYIADLTGANANVYLELGVRWALRDHVTVLVCQNIKQVFMTGLFAGEFLSAQPHEIGDAYPSQGEFLAKFVNQATGRCIARNGVQGDPNKYESPDPNNQASNIYQANCSTDRGDLSHTLILDPINDGWLIRSSVKINLCLQAKGSPSDDQHLAACSQEGDDRQQWIILRVLHAAPEVVVIKNRNTGMCLAHPPPPADGSDIRIFQYQYVPDARTEWVIEKQPPIGDKDCHNQREVRIRNRETVSLYAGYGDQIRPRMGDAGPTMSLARAQQSAHGCTIEIVGPSANCMGVSESPPAVGVLWMPCNGKPNQRWMIESLVKQNGEKWLRFRPSYDMSRCLQPEEDGKGAPLTALRCNDVWRQQWAMS